VFASSYADQNEADFAAFKQAVADGRLEIKPESKTGKGR
jgi:hypothetical protein